MAESTRGEPQSSQEAVASLSPGYRSGMSTTGSEDLDYEPSTDEGDEEGQDSSAIAILQRLLEGDEGDMEDDQDDETPHGTIEVEIEEEGEGEGGGGAETETGRTADRRRRIIRLLRSTELGRMFGFVIDGDDDFNDAEEDNDGDFYSMWRRRRRRDAPDPDRFPKVPSDEGRELMNSGSFGHNEVKTISMEDRKNIGQTKKLARRILDRELAAEEYSQRKANQRLMAQGMIPSSNADMIIHYNQPVYSGQFSDDGNFFFSANKDYKVRMYDTSNPYKWRYYKTVDYLDGQWTLTDATLSPDNKFLAYTSIRSVVCLATTDPNDEGDPYNLDFADSSSRGGYRSRMGDFGIWSVRFSGDGRELVAGARGGMILVYDIESRRTLHRIEGHQEDVNAVCFADTSSPHILYSGSDDATLKVWDTRSLGDSREAGAFVGHIEGLTYIDSKMDGRYILSNGKDQSMKLWDLRMVMSTANFNKVRRSSGPRRQSHFDYRWSPYDEDDWYRHPNDNSLVTFRGHRVLRTLIRCHFSPPGSTNSRYVYSGSEDGKVYIWNMDATLAGVVDVYKATKNSRPFHRGYEMMGWADDDESHSQWKTCVRDASWHPNAPMIVASAWNGYGLSTGTCTVHSWNDGAEEDEAEPKMGLRVDEELDIDPSLYRAGAPKRSRGARRSVFRMSRNAL